MRGVLKLFNSRRGTVVLAPPDGAPEMPINLAEAHAKVVGQLADGDSVEFTIDVDDRGRPCGYHLVIARRVQ